MNIIGRDGDLITLNHFGHSCQVQITDCKYSRNLIGEENEQFLLTPEMICVREDCPECATAAEARGISGYHTSAQTCFPLGGDAEAMEMHIRYRIGEGRDIELVIEELEGQVPDAAAQARLDHARSKIYR